MQYSFIDLVPPCTTRGTATGAQPRSSRFTNVLSSTTRMAMVAMVAGCTLIPDYHRPVTPLATTYAGMAQGAQITPHRAAADLGWREFFVDDRLKALISIAIRDNRDLQSAVMSLAQAQGEYTVQNAALFPALGVTGSAMYMGPSDTAGFSFAPGQGRTVSTFRYYSTGFGFSSYEIDLFGRIRSLTREASETALAQEENARSVMISVISQVANAYLAWLGDHELLRITDETLATQRDTLRLTQARVQHGEATDLTLHQAETQMEQAAAMHEQYTRQIAQDEHLLTLLIGAPVPLDLPAPRPFGQQTILTDLPAGLPSDLMERRPDVMSAEHQLKAANADIGAARAAFFPRVTLTATNGTSALQFRQLFTSGAHTWGIDPSIQIPIFTWGQNSGNLATSKAKRDAQVAAYEKTVQTAFREVSDALTSRETYYTQTVHLQELVHSSDAAFRLAQMRYTHGVDSYLTTLDAQRTLFTAQQSLISVQTAKYQNLVTLYRALGGGWTANTPPPPPPAGQGPRAQTSLTNAATTATH